MSIALARKYRPRRFADVAVQSHVCATLQGAIAGGRVAHGYLLCGPRGVGKTTLARVLAMALNCERRQPVPAGSGPPAGGPRATGEPCGECDSCRRIWSGSASLDVVEIDAASNRGVDDARELRERAMYAPSGDNRYKVYIVDEAHMLTREAWNALLKILEEPPPRVVFVFATTEPQKIAQNAAPVLSRLQRFDLKRIGIGEIKTRLAFVLAQESVPVEPDALALIARAADGSMRDALSLTDQVLSLGGGAVSAEGVRESLGLVADDEFLGLLDLVVERRAADIFPFVARLADAGVDFATFFAGFGDIVRAQLATVLGAELPDVSERTQAALSERAARQTPADLVRMLSILTEFEPRFRKSGQQQLLVEATLVRLALLDRTVDVEALLEAVRSDYAPEPGKQTPPRVPAVIPRTRPEPKRELHSAPQGDRPPAPTQAAPPGPRALPATARSVEPAPSPTRVDTLDINGVAGVWDALVELLRAAGKTLVATALAHATPASVTNSGVITIALDEPNEFYGKAIENAAPDIVSGLRTWFVSVERVVVQNHGRDGQAAPRRLTGEMLRAEQLESVRKRDPVLATAIDALELEIVE